MMTLKSKIIGSSALLLLVMATAFVFFLNTSVHQVLENEVDRRAISIGHHFAEMSADAHLSESTSLLQTHLSNYMTIEKYLAYIIIMDGDNAIQASAFDGELPLKTRQEILKRELPKTQHYYRTKDGTQLEEFYVPVGTGRDGGVYVGIKEEMISGEINQLIRRLLPVVLIVTLIGIVLTYMLASAMTRPIAGLMEGVGRVTRGDLDTKIIATSTDEIGLLADSFNQMTENLRTSTVSREYMEKLIDCMNDVLMVISLEGCIKSVNQACCKLTGSDQTALIGRRFDDFEVQGMPVNMFSAFTRTLEEEMVQGVESSFRLPGGESVPILFSMALMKDEAGSPQAVVFAAQDISPLKRVQEELQRQQKELEDINHHLEDIVSSRTAELAITNEGLRAEVVERQRRTEELREAKDVAESANRAKTEFLANMSHEMRTPLNSVIGGTELLDTAELLPHQKKVLMMVRQAGDSLLMLVNDLIDLSRIEAGHLELVIQPFNPRDMVDDIMRMLEGEAERKRIRLTSEISAEIPRFLSGDQMRLKQVLVNLLANAVKFTDNGGSINVSLLTSGGDDGTAIVTFSVRDTGIGIEADKLEMIFESFSQADTSITRRFGGSGLGLAISRKLVEVMGGAISVESEPDVGSTFSFTISFKAVEKSVLATAVEASQALLAIDGTRRILLVDDSAENRILIRLLLHKLPLLLDEAGNGQEALDLFDNNHYDLILMDIQMPIMDGYTATQAIRTRESDNGSARTPIIALTAHAYESDLRACREAGCDDHVAKPFKKQALLDCLAMYFRDERYV